MLRFYAPAEDSRFKGSATYLESLQRLFSQDEGSGLIELLVGEDRQVIMLLHNGKMIAGYLVEADHAQPFEIANLGRVWSGVTSPIRYLQLPVQAVRAAWQALEWYPPTRSLHATGTPDACLEALSQEGASGLLHLALTDLDGFVLLENGQPVTGETLLATPRGFAESLSAAGNLTDLESQAWLYTPRSSAPVGEMTGLRVAFAAWIFKALQAYHQMVGQSLINALNYDLNTHTRLKRWKVRLVGERLIDHQLFTTPEAAARVYQVLLEHMAAHMERVVGAGLARRLLSDSSEQLGSMQRAALARYALVQEQNV